MHLKYIQIFYNTLTYQEKVLHNNACTCVILLMILLNIYKAAADKETAAAVTAATAVCITARHTFTIKFCCNIIRFFSQHSLLSMKNQTNLENTIKKKKLLILLIHQISKHFQFVFVHYLYLSTRLRTILLDGLWLPRN